MRNCILLLFIFVFNSNFAQEKQIDSLKTALTKTKVDTVKINICNDLAMNYQSIDSELGLKYAGQALQLAQKINWEKGIATSYSTFGINYYVQNDVKKALYHFNQALKYCSNDKKAKSKILKNIGAVYNTSGNYEKALDYNFEALKISEEINDQEHIARVLTNIGNIYYYLEDSEKAINYYKRSLVINRKLAKKQSICKNLQNIGSALIMGAKDAEAKKYYSEALKIAEEIEDKEALVYNYYYIGIIENNLNNNDKALVNFEYSEKLASEIGNTDLTILSAKEIASIYLDLYKQTKDKKWLSKSELIIVSIQKNINRDNDLQTYSLIQKLASEIYEEKSDFKKSLQFLKEHDEIKDSIQSDESKETLRNLESQKIIEIKEKQLQINHLELQAKEKQKWYFILGILLLGIIGSLLFYQSWNRKKTNEKLQLLNSELDLANKTKARFFSILNHDLRSPVSNLIHFLHLQKENPELLDEESKNRMQNKTISGAENLLTSMEDILIWSKGQMENFQPQLKMVSIQSIFEDTHKHFESEENINIFFENPNNIQINTDENYLKTIVRNLTGNAIKALTKTENPTIIWKAWQEENKIHLSISDNGPGAAQEQFKALYDDKEVVGIKTGLGLHLIRDLAKAINCEIRVDSKINQGTTITLSFKQQ